MDIILTENDYSNYKQLDYTVPFQGYRRYVAFAYTTVNLIGFTMNFWVLYMVAPLLFSSQVKIMKSILFYIITLCISDLMIMFGMSFLIIEIIVGTWKFSTFSCIAFLVFEAMNKFVAPVIVVLISRTCYATVCLNAEKQRAAASLKCAVTQVIGSMVLVIVLLWPLYVYSQVSSLYFNVNTTSRTVHVLRKCTFMPPPMVEIIFGILSCIGSYAIPLCGTVYWFVSVPFFLRKHAENSICSNVNTVPARRFIATVLVLAVVYVLCWSPYWLVIFAHKFMRKITRNEVIASYFVHLLPYISCSAYPVIFTALNRRIKVARAQMNQQNRRRVAIGSVQKSNKTMKKRATSRIRLLRSRIQSFPNIVHQTVLNLNDNCKNHLQIREIISTDDCLPNPILSAQISVRSLNVEPLMEHNFPRDSSKSLIGSQAETIELEEGDSLL